MLCNVHLFSPSCVHFSIQRRLTFALLLMELICQAAPQIMREKMHFLILIIIICDMYVLQTAIICKKLFFTLVFWMFRLMRVFRCVRVFSKSSST